jgi:hypothetical protein
MELIEMTITKPAGMTQDEAVRRARALIPCKTGSFQGYDISAESAYGSMECEDGFYENNPDGGSYGPDDAGVQVEWETP